MTDKQFYILVGEVTRYADRDSFISDLALSSMWGDDETSEIQPERIAALGSIWDACHRSVKDIASAAGLSNRKLAERFCIPYRTVEDWCAGKRECNIYIRLMMQECLGILQCNPYHNHRSFAVKIYHE